MSRKTARRIKKITVAKHALAPGDFDGDGYEMDRWWVRDPNNPSRKYVGPYDRKPDAMEAKKGLERFWRYEND